MITGFSGIYEKWMHLMITESYKRKKGKQRVAKITINEKDEMNVKALNI